MEQDVDLNSSKDIFLLSDDEVGSAPSKEPTFAETKINEEAAESPDIFEVSDSSSKDIFELSEEEAAPNQSQNSSKDIFLSDDEEEYAACNLSIDIFDNCESCSCFDNDVTIRPIGDIIPTAAENNEKGAEPMEIDPKPGPSKINETFSVHYYAQIQTPFFYRPEDIPGYVEILEANARKLAERGENDVSMNDFRFINTFEDNIPLTREEGEDIAINTTGMQIPIEDLQMQGPPPKIPHMENRAVEEVRLQKTLQKFREDTENGGRHFGRYMQLKKDKLRYQVNVVSRTDTVISNIFQGVSIFVNGHTDPPALELRELIQTHGGEYHCYMEYGVTTYTIASSLAAAKVNKTRKNEIFLLPGWIIDSIAAGECLPIEHYRLLEEEQQRNQPITNFFGRGGEEPIVPTREKALDARDPNFIQEFYARSRLHLISTLAQDMKDFMMNLRETGHFTTEEWDKTNFPKAEKLISEAIVFHIDLDCFFVSVALRNRPELKDKPVAITHSKGSASAPGFSEIASCSYAARNLGLRNGMLIRDALKSCPKLICLPYQFDEYREVSKQIYTLVSKFTLEVRAVSCDEMYVNFSKICSDRRIDDIIGLANHIRARIKEITGCPASVGIGHNMLIARLSTRKAKPDGVFWCRKQNSVSFIQDEKLENIPGIGYHTMNKLKERFGIVEHCGDLQNIHIDDLGDCFGKKSAEHLAKRCRGEDDSMVDFIGTSERKSVSCDINYGIRFTKKEEAVDFLRRIVEEVCKKLNSCRRLTGAVTLKLLTRCADAPVDPAKYLGTGRCDSTTKTALLKKSSDDPQIIYKEILALYDGVRPKTEDLRGVGIHCGRLVPADPGVRRLQVVKDFFAPRKGAAPWDRKLNLEKPKKPKESETIVKNWITKTPQLSGRVTMNETKLELKAMLIEEPSRKNIILISRFLRDLATTGYYQTLRLYIIWLGQLQHDEDVCGMWFEPLQAIFERLETRMFWRNGAKWIEKELKTNPLCNNQCHNICPCIDPFNCWCETNKTK